jgi:hypothetical protein
MTLHSQFSFAFPTPTKATGNAGNPLHAQMGLTSDLCDVINPQEHEGPLIKLMAGILRQKKKLIHMGFFLPDVLQIILTIAMNRQ